MREKPVAACPRTAMRASRFKATSASFSPQRAGWL